MALLGDPALRPSLAEQAQQRTVAPAAELHGHPHKEQDHEHAFKCEEDIRIASVALAAVAVWFDRWEPFANVSVIGILGLIVGGWPIFKEAAENIVARRMTMELSMSIAIVARS